VFNILIVVVVAFGVIYLAPLFLGGRKRFMKWLKSIGEATGLGSILILLFLLVVMTINGISTGEYVIVLNSNLYSEHYFELGLLIFGLICYIKYRKINFKKFRRTKI